jgi:fructose-specific phosphotransferase system IIC component
MNSSFLKFVVKFGLAVAFSFAVSQTIKLEQKVRDNVNAYFDGNETDELNAA